MSVHLKAVIVCDDLRQEVGNKFTACGMYNERISFPPPSAPNAMIGLPKLAILFVVAGMTGVASYSYRHFLHYGDENVPDVPMQQGQRAPAADEHNFVFQVAPFVVPGPGRLRAILDLRVGNQTKHFEYAFEIAVSASSNRTVVH